MRKTTKRGTELGKIRWPRRGSGLRSNRKWRIRNGVGRDENGDEATGFEWADVCGGEIGKGPIDGERLTEEN